MIYWVLIVYHGILGIFSALKIGCFKGVRMSVTVSIKVRREVVEIADKMVRYGLARSRSHAFNIIMEKGLGEVREEIKFWDEVYKKVEELRRRNFVIEHGGLNEILRESRER